MTSINNKQSRKWQLTINNPIEKDLSHDMIKSHLENFKSLLYFCMADEIGSEGTYHTHLYVCFKNGVKFNTLKKQFPESHIENVRGTSCENRDYILKEGRWEKDEKSETKVEGTFEEWGELPDDDNQGCRNDITILYEMIKNGCSDSEIIETNPAYMMKLDKINLARQTLLESQYKSVFRELEVTYVWGETGSGKTRSIMEAYGYENVFRVTNYAHGGFDGYKGQDVIIFEEFRSSCKIQDMLNYLDGYPLELPCRYANKVACYTKVFITTNIDLSEQYVNEQTYAVETWKALIRRIHKIIVYSKDNFDFITEYSTPDYFKSDGWCLL